MTPTQKIAVKSIAAAGLAAALNWALEHEAEILKLIPPKYATLGGVVAAIITTLAGLHTEKPSTANAKTAAEIAAGDIQQAADEAKGAKA